MVGVGAVALILLAGAAGTILLRQAWRRRDRFAALRVCGGLALMAGMIAGAMILIGPAKGVAAAFAIAPLAILAVVATGLSVKPVRRLDRRDVAAEPLEGAPKIWRGVVRFVLAGPLGLLAAMSIAFCYAVWMPGAIQTRLLIAALLVPGLWGLAMTWTLADQRLFRATAVLATAALAGFGIAALGSIA